MVTIQQLSKLYKRAHELMRSIDGLQPQEAFDELLKYLFFKQANEEFGPAIPMIPALNSDGSFTLFSSSTAQTIRQRFSEYVVQFNSWFRDLWKDGAFHLSDHALLTLHSLFDTIRFSGLSFDLRSAALKEFLTADIRRGLGIYLTPDDVVKMMVEFVNPSSEAKVYDPACGSGTFLIETLKFLRQKSSTLSNVHVWGTDKNPRMLLIAELNLGHFSSVTFHRQVVDALFPETANKYDWLEPNHFDVIFTNPPFGVMLEGQSYNLQKFATCRTENGGVLPRQTSDIVFIEQCLRMLKPGGTLAIVLPKSAVTNSRLAAARKALDTLGYVYAVVILPSETFATTGTQTTTVVLFIRKFSEEERRDEKIGIAVATVTNVGFDATGRLRSGNQLLELAVQLRSCVTQGISNGICKIHRNVPKEHTFSYLPTLISGRNAITTKLTLGDVIETVSLGRTPARNSYAGCGLFLVKVGNLSGSGINWLARDRNFVDGLEKEKRLKSQTLMLREGDILLTSAAHNPAYIAKKVDIVSSIPHWIGGVASFVAEVMMVRVNKRLIDPYILLAYLRSPQAFSHISGLIKGQTAHLYPSDLLTLPIPEILLEPTKELTEFVDILKSQEENNSRFNELMFREQQFFAEFSFHVND